MQQTPNYKLNLLETSDVFSPNPLNENTQKTEAALLAEADAREALDSRVQVLELRRMVLGTYHGDGETSQFINLGFTPKAVFACRPCANTPYGFVMPGHNMVMGSTQGTPTILRIVDNGFEAMNKSGLNSSSYEYHYLALG